MKMMQVNNLATDVNSSCATRYKKNTLFNFSPVRNDAACSRRPPLAQSNYIKIF